jgi:hypothetical protein
MPRLSASSGSARPHGPFLEREVGEGGERVGDAGLVAQIAEAGERLAVQYPGAGHVALPTRGGR